MALQSTRPLTENTRNLLGGKGRPSHKADNLTAICEPIIQKMCRPRRLTTLRASTACYRDSFTLFFLPTKQIRDISPCNVSNALQQGASRLQTLCVNLWTFSTNITSLLRIQFLLLNPTE
jgi:hypothetical protein